MRKFFCYILTILLLTACVGEVDIPSNGGTPASSASQAQEEAEDSLGTFTLTLTGERATRATQTVITKEEADLFLITIYKGSDIVRPRTTLKNVNTTLSAGYGYKVFAESVSEETAITSNDGWGQRRYAGYSASFAIKAGQTTAVNVGCSVVNAGFEVNFDKTVSEYFTNYDITIHDGTRTIVFDANTAGKIINQDTIPGRVAYFNLDEDGNHTISYTIHATGPKTIEKTGTLNLSKAVISRINLRYERSDFDFVITLDEEQLFVDDIINITDEDIQVEDGTTEIFASHQPYTIDAASIATRTALSDDGLTITWQASDAIAVYDFTSTKHRFPITLGDDGHAKFTEKVTPKSPSFAAIYPYEQAGTSASSLSNLTATIATTQYASTSTFDSNLNVSVAKGNRNLDGSPTQVTFYNACQLLRFSVPAYAADKINSIQLTATTPIAGKLNIDYSGDTPSFSIANSESKTITILPPKRTSTFAEGEYYITIAPTQLTGFTLSFTSTAKNYALTSPTTFGQKAGHIFPIGAIDLINTPTVSASHVYAEGLLQGTKVQLTGAPIEGGSWSATIKNASGKQVRTIAAATGNLTSAETDASWPYLPKGNYTVSYTFNRSNGTQQTQEITLSVPAPTLTLTVDGYTAHTKYEAGDVTAANACDRLTFYAPSARLSVANALMANTNYTHSYKRTFNKNSNTTSETSNSPSWGNYTNVPVSGSLYTFTVEATFAGETATANKQVRITGLPVNFQPPTQDTGWANDAGTTNFNSDHVRLGNASWSQPHRIKNSSWINVPKSTKMSLDYDIVLHRAAVNTTANVKAGSQTIVECTDSKYNNDVHNTGVKIFTTSDAVSSFTCEGSYGSGATCSKVYKLFFQYAK